MPHIPRNVHVHDVEVLLYLLQSSCPYRYCAVGDQCFNYMKSKICSRGTTRISHAHTPYSCILIFYYVFFTTPVFPTNTSTLFPCQRHRGAIKELEALRSVTSHPISSGLNACALVFIHAAAAMCLFEHTCCLFL